MPFIGNKPSAVPLTSADIADGIITSAKIVDGTIVNADINASSAIALSKLSTTGTADATTFLRGDGAYTAVSSDFVRIATTTVSSSVSIIDFTSVFTSTYDRYIITIDNLTISASAYVSMRVIYSTNTVDSTTVYTQAGVGDKVNTSGTVTGDLGLSNYNTYGELYIDYHQAIASGTGTEGKGLTATIHLSTPANTTNGKAMTMQSGYFNGSSEYVTQNSFWYYRSTNAITGLRFYPHSGNFTSATISIYGLKKS
jgi:hypothetical protein